MMKALQVVLLTVALAEVSASSALPAEECQDAERAGFSMLQAHLVSKDRNQDSGPYYWASGRGNFPSYAVSTTSGPFNLTDSLAWEWHHPLGRFATLTYGTAIDEDSNIYLSAADGVRKFDPSGRLLWEFPTLPKEVMNAPFLYDGMVYASDTYGFVFALDMQTGKEVWNTQIADKTGQDNGFNMVHDGIALAACDWRPPTNFDAGANQQVKGLNASTGEELWSFEPDVPVWNFLPLFVEGGSFVFQDMTGKAYRVLLKTGELVWKAGGVEGTWTDGGAALGPNGLVYTVANNHPMPLNWIPEHAPGTLSAFNVSDGLLVWKITTPRPPNASPAVGYVKNFPGLSIVMPVCQQVRIGATCDVEVYDAETGGLRWTFHGPTQTGLLQAGDAEGIAYRKTRGIRPFCAPNGWSASTIDSEGTVFVGNEEGNFYALRDMNGDGVVFGPDEVALYDAKAAFSGSSSPAFAPGLMAVASCDTLLVFKPKSP